MKQIVEIIGDMAMLRSAVRMILPTEKHRDALEILASISEQTQFDPGCVSSRLYRDMNDVRIVLLEELWLTPEELLRHLKSEKYRKILLVIEMAVEPPEVRFDTIARTSGLETIEKARNVHAG
jgi:quinol monooxygenase YgiN